MRSYLSIAASLSTALLLFAAPAANALPPGGADTQLRGAKVKLDRYAVRAGGRIKVSGTKWRAKGSRVTGKKEVTVKLDDGAILAVFPLRNRRFSGYVRIPKQVRKGRHWLRFLAARPLTSVKSKPIRVR